MVYKSGIRPQKKKKSYVKLKRELDHYFVFESIPVSTFKILNIISLTFQCVAILVQSALQVVLDPHGLQSHLALLGSYASPTRRKR